MKRHQKILVFLKEHRKLIVFLIFCVAVLVFALARYFNGYAFRNRELFARITDVTDRAYIKKTKLEVTPAAGTMPDFYIYLSEGLTGEQIRRMVDELVANTDKYLYGSSPYLKKWFRYTEFHLFVSVDGQKGGYNCHRYAARDDGETLTYGISWDDLPVSNHWAIENTWDGTVENFTTPFKH